MAAITPRLRHVVATAGALATLHAHAPGRVEAVVGSGFTAQLMLGKKPVPWAEVERYAVALRALLAGCEIDWDGALTGRKYGTRTGITPPGPGIPLHVAAHGPRGYAVAERTGDGIVTNMSHRGGNPPPADMRRVQVLYYGTVLAPGEGYDDPRVLPPPARTPRSSCTWASSGWPATARNAPGSARRWRRSTRAVVIWSCTVSTSSA